MADKDLLIKIKADTKEAVSQTKNLTKEVKSLTKESKDLNNTDFKNINGGFSLLSTTVKGLVAGFVSIQGILKLTDFAKMGEDAEQSGDAFNRVVEEMGLNAEEEFNKIKDASSNLIPEAAIKQSAVIASSLGIPINELAGLMEVARAKSREMGTDVQSAFNDLATGIGRGSPMILDNLGLTIKLGEANQKMADSLGKTVEELTKQEKTMAIVNATVEAGADSVARYADAGLSSKEKTQELNKEIVDLQTEIGKALIPAMDELKDSTLEYLKSIDSDDIKRFGDSISTLVTAISSLGSVISGLNDIAIPDFLGGDDAGFFDTVLDGWGKILTITNELTYNFTKLGDVTDRQSSMFDAAVESAKGFDGTKESLEGNVRVLESLIKENEKLLSQDIVGNSIAQVEASEKLTEQTKILKDELSKLKDSDTFKQIAKDTADAADEAKQYADGLKYLEKEYASREKEHKKLMDNLLKNEDKLTKDIVSINKKLSDELTSIADERAQSSEDIQNKINDIVSGGLNEYQEYLFSQQRADEAYSDAKESLISGNLDAYKRYISQYESLSTQSAGSEIKNENKIAITKEQTAQNAIDALNKTKALEDAYFTKKEAQARANHEAEISRKEIELDAIKIQLEAQKSLLDTIKDIAEASGQSSISTDTSGIDNAILKIEELKTKLREPVSANIDNTGLDTTKSKIEEIQRITINGVELEVKSDTTAADFGISKLITKVSKDEVSIELNPEYEAAEKQLDTFRANQELDPIVKKLEADTSEAQKSIAEISKPSESVHTVDPNAREVLSVIDQIKQPTSSVHTIYQKIVNTGGGDTSGYEAGGFTGVGSNTDIAGFVHKNEFVFPADVTKSIGVDNLYSLMRNIRGYSDGGLVGGSSGSSLPTQPINLNIGGESFSVMADEQVAAALTRYINSQGGM